MDKDVFTLIRDRFAALERRLDLRDEALDERLTRLEDTAGKTLVETKRTNGRVTSLEEARAEGRLRREFLIGALCIVVGGAMSEILRALGL